MMRIVVKIIDKVFGTRSERELKRIMHQVDEVESLRPKMQALSDEELKGKTAEFKKRLEEGATLDAPTESPRNSCTCPIHSASRFAR